MTGAAVVEVVDLGVAAALHALARRLEDLREGWEVAVGAALDEAVPSVPVLTGALVDSLKATATEEGGEIASSLIYAGVIDQGWPARNIEGSRFMDQAAEYLEQHAADDLSVVIQHTIDQLGLS